MTRQRSEPPATSAAEAEAARRHLGREFRLEPYTDYLRFERGLSDRTVDAYRRDLRHMVDFLGERGVEQVEGVRFAHLRDYVFHLGERGLKGSSVRRALSSMRAYFSFLMEEQVLVRINVVPRYIGYRNVEDPGASPIQRTR